MLFVQMSIKQVVVVGKMLPEQVSQGQLLQRQTAPIFSNQILTKKSGSNFVLEFCLKIGFDVVMEFPGNEGLVGVTGFRRVPVPVGVTSGRGWGWAAARKDAFLFGKVVTFIVKSIDVSEYIQGPMF
jgi:hypothetical protein